MPRWEETLQRVFDPAAVANIRFEDIRQLLIHMGFEEWITGSHHIFRKRGIPGRLNVQRDGSHAKAYQVRQIRKFILEHHLSEGL